MTRYKVPMATNYLVVLARRADGNVSTEYYDFYLFYLVVLARRAGGNVVRSNKRKIYKRTDRIVRCSFTSSKVR